MQIARIGGASIEEKNDILQGEVSIAAEVLYILT